MHEYLSWTPDLGPLRRPACEDRFPLVKCNPWPLLAANSISGEIKNSYKKCFASIARFTKSIARKIWKVFEILLFPSAVFQYFAKWCVGARCGRLTSYYVFDRVRKWSQICNISMLLWMLEDIIMCNKLFKFVAMWAGIFSGLTEAMSWLHAFFTVHGMEILAYLYDFLFCAMILFFF